MINFCLTYTFVQPFVFVPHLTTVSAMAVCYLVMPKTAHNKGFAKKPRYVNFHNQNIQSLNHQVFEVFQPFRLTA